MAFWRTPGFSQPSPIEQILDKDGFTLEELLDEEDVVQEAKALNARLVAFLREPPVVEKLLNYLVKPPSDPDDPNQQYKYPFTACEVLCCEVDAVFDTLLGNAALMDLLFSPLDAPPPLACKPAGYFARVACALLLRKPAEAMAHLSGRPGLLERLVAHAEVPAVADVIKRVAGADEHAAAANIPAHTAWLAGTPLLGMLLERLGAGHGAGAAGGR